MGLGLHLTSATSVSDTEPTPCDSHLKKAFDRYELLLKDLHCLCKDLIALGEKSCCLEPTSSQTSLISTKASEDIQNNELAPKAGTANAKGCKKSCCGDSTPGVKALRVATKTVTANEKGCTKNCCGSPTPTVKAPTLTAADHTKRDCCAKAIPTAAPASPTVDPNPAVKSCCKVSTEPTPSVLQDSCGRDNQFTLLGCESSRDVPPKKACCRKHDEELKKTCCSKDGEAPKIPTLGAVHADAYHPKGAVVQCSCTAKTGCCETDEKSETPVSSIAQITGGNDKHIGGLSRSVDLEKGIGGLEHLVISVQGMTCTGCETKLYKSILALPGAYNVRTSLVRAEAEFDLDLEASKGTVESTVQTLESMTDFACKQVIRRGGILDVIIAGAIQPFLNQELPEGIQKILKSGDHEAQIIYDPRVIGARDISRELLGPQDALASLKQSAMNASRRKFLVALWLTIFSAILTIPVLVLAWAPIPEHKITYGAVSLALATIVQFVVAGPFYPKALKALFFARMIEMDLLIVISTSTAYVFSIIAYACMVRGQPLEVESFFETSTLLITLIMCGRVATAYARDKAIGSVSVDSLQAATATILDEKDQEETIDCRLLQYGDIFKVYPDMIVPTDGTVFSGGTEVDESMVTGESDLVPKSIGSPLIAGSVNRTGTVTARLTRLPNENTIANISDMVNEANYSKPKIQEIADHVAGYFVPTILGITVAVFVIWIAIGKTIQGRSSNDAVVNALTYALSALIVSCPCAIGLAVPMVVVIAGDVAAKDGLVFRTGETITSARKVCHVIFDKTGTLTQGKPIVVSEICLNGPIATSRALTLALTRENKHPISAAVAAYLIEGDVERIGLSGLTAVVGKGVEANIPETNVKVRGGNVKWIGAEDNLEVQDLLSQKLTVFCVRRGPTLIAAYGLRDTLRPDAVQVISELRARGVEISIVSGDEENAVRAVADELGIPAVNVRSRYSPGDKKKYIEDLTTSSLKHLITLFIGDGTNDAPALAQASIGVHVNNGTEVARSASDAVLLTPSLQGILALVDLSKAVMHRIKFNFGWSFTYNTIAILLAAGAFVNVRIEPAYAGLGELISVFPVILAALHLKWR
ncbi:uncharacterized protein A1O9_12874 [Exophiala aquamarina CBS 119918]|uniref:HMA domain-containing protein n=1 Tax=Exophiala aquamarina CBS 119918 TaxID=1182545 RepID=A0A072NVI9_9EURO|nr:uncharacterized protein A1O9_12874 [Exophiala aquamarina CBS 119918]KEF51058.1 hypothetical protein A1O9_12874 [Exophiala aquamarina CBS 119918]